MSFAGHQQNWRMSGPWWTKRVSTLLEPHPIAPLDVGALWRLSKALQFVRENVDPRHLPVDFRSHPGAQSLWEEFLRRETQVQLALGEATSHEAGRIRRHELGPHAFRTLWQGLGFAPNVGDAGTPADDYLDALFHVARYTVGEERPAGGTPNMSSRAERTADFLAVAEPRPDDVVIDLGSGNGKLTLTVSASTSTQVIGVEYGATYVAAARVTASELALENLRFIHADVRDVDLSAGSIFYLYYPFHGPVARTVADTLGALALAKDIVVYTSGPAMGFGEHFLKHVTDGAMTLDRRGAFGEVMVLRSART